MRITPTQTSFAPSGPPPSFRIETDSGYPYYAVQLASQSLLFNGANVGRRAQSNFFDSWLGDSQFSGRGVRREIAGVHLQTDTGRANYALPQIVWERLRRNQQLFYRLIISRNERLPRDTRSVHSNVTKFSVSDNDAARAPSVSTASLPARPARAVVTRFRGTGALSRDDFPAQARRQMTERGFIQGRDGDFRFVLLDARFFHMTVLECHEKGLTDTVALMPRKPDAIINGQFISDVFGIGTEGQVVREGLLINANSQPDRYYIAQKWRGIDVSDYQMGRGNPRVAEDQLRVAFGGLGPVLLRGAPISPLSGWAQSIYDRPAETGRGVIAIERDQGLILLLVQEDSTLFTTTSMTMTALRRRLQTMGFDDAVFNDGSDSESLFADGAWLLEPGTFKDEAMDFAISFVDRSRNRRFHFLSIDGTRTRDGESFVNGIARPPITHYAPRNISSDLESVPALSSIGPTFRAGVIQAWRTTNAAQADQVSRIMQNAGQAGNWADIMHVSSHAQRHGELYYHENDDDSRPVRFIAPLWASSFRPIWNTTPSWLILAGCSVLSVRYSRGLILTASERRNLETLHHDMHGTSAAVPGLTATQRTIFEVYHPGWAWYERVFRRSPSLRGVLGYWYRSPGGVVGDEGIMNDFTEKLREGKTFLEAWESANTFLFGLRQAAWAAMIRDHCEDDTLATLETSPLPFVPRDFRYYDKFQSGDLVVDAYREANRLTNSERVGSVTVRYNEHYDKFAIEELQELATSPTAANFLEYNDGQGPVVVRTGR